MANTNPLRVPVIGQQQEAIRAAIANEIRQIANGVYVQLVARYLDTLDTHQEPQLDRVRELSAWSREAAILHLETFGVRLTPKGEPPEDKIVSP